MQKLCWYAVCVKAIKTSDELNEKNMKENILKVCLKMRNIYTMGAAQTPGWQYGSLQIVTIIFVTSYSLNAHAALSVHAVWFAQGFTCQLSLNLQHLGVAASSTAGEDVLEAVVFKPPAM